MDEYFVGWWMFVFFGFVNCLDVCLMMFVEVVVVMEDLGIDVEKIQFIFILIDFECDIFVVLVEYVFLFNVGIIGLIGMLEQIVEMFEIFLIFYEWIEEVLVLNGYIMGYILYLFFFDLKVCFIDFWVYGIFVEEIFIDLRERF